MRCSCFCGATFDADGDLAVCPNCGEPTALPSLSERDVAAMCADVELMKRYPALADEPTH